MQRIMIPAIICSNPIASSLIPNLHLSAKRLAGSYIDFGCFFPDSYFVLIERFKRFVVNGFKNLSGAIKEYIKLQFVMLTGCWRQVSKHDFTVNNPFRSACWHDLIIGTKKLYKWLRSNLLDFLSARPLSLNRIMCTRAKQHKERNEPCLHALIMAHKPISSQLLKE